MKFNRSSGILLHPTSLPSPYGIGDLGPQAHRWLDFLAGTGCGLWQVLPLGPTGYGDSPYQCFSAFAGNPYIISPDALLEEGLLKPEDLADYPKFPDDQVDFGNVIVWKLSVLDQAFLRYKKSAPARIKTALAAFEAEQASWLDDFGLFMALKDAHGGAPWHTWEAPLRDRQPEAMEKARIKYASAIQKQIFRQFLFFSQWSKLRQHAAELGIKIIGDIPIFVAHDSADVWANPGLFFLDDNGKPTVVAGVPPDYFSPTGQLWGNPLYRWNVHAASGYAWWIERIRSTLTLVDILRIDHFRGFAGYWEVKGNAKTAEKGRWLRGPGKAFFKAMRAALGDLPIIAEDLGVITPDVVDLRDSFELPGMKILQFAFGSGPYDPFLPHNYPVNCVVYTGTHDNDTARGWYERVAEPEKQFYRRYLNRDGMGVAWDLIRAVWSSVAVFGLAPMQDFMNLDNTARMNYPGNPSGNWQWRMPEGAFNADLQRSIKELNHMYERDKDRLPPPPPDWPAKYPGLK
ncbi:MAG TPA: 4-alpha-glucanotransferase [Anaerolineales bacterium]|nr:4-alpha-glucanotransferase [Anaerolineales bacterium]